MVKVKRWGSPENTIKKHISQKEKRKSDKK